MAQYAIVIYNNTNYVFQIYILKNTYFVISACNLRIVFKKTLTVICHNGSGYDFKHIISYLDESNTTSIKVNGENPEEFFTITLNKKLRFIDSLKHLPSK